MGNCCKKQPAPPGAGEGIGKMVFRGSGLCDCRPPWRFSNKCCDGKKPSGPEWEAAEPEFKQLIQEVDECVDLSSKCCGSADAHSALSQLRSSGWEHRANECLKKHGLCCGLRVDYVYVSNGQYGGTVIPMCVLRIYKYSRRKNIFEHLFAKIS